MRHIYISPHLDDAALSAGGWIYEQVRAGAPVEIWTLAAGFPPDAELSPFAQALHARWGISDAADLIRARRAEDIRAAQILGARTLHFDFLDCIYRRAKSGGWLYDDVFVPPHEEESELPEQIAKTLAVRLNPDDQIICQLGIGSHVDHAFARRAAELLHRPLWYAADIPYLFNAPDELTPQISAMRETLHATSASAIAAWQDSVAQYVSQIGGLFADETDMRAKIENYAVQSRGVKFWR